MSAPSRRRRGLRRIRRVTVALALGLFVVFAVGVLRVFQTGASPLVAAGALYGASVAYGMGEMARLRERRLFRPGGRRDPDRAVLWWGVRVALVLAVSSIPAVLVLGGLTRR